MSCFRLPKSLISRVSSLCAKFWWGSTDKHKKLHWKKWEELCKPKEVGVLNFRSLEEFNQAMLAMQVWRVLNNPHSRVAQIIKGRYLPTFPLLDVSIRNHSSYFWKGFVWGMDLLKKGMRKLMGNGQSIKMFSDPWLPNPTTFKVISTCQSGSTMVVADFITTSH